ncbi:MAG TPA: biopolymer transporter ExbD [Steroidobacteraceae bacterium]|nr:biopolymer transporter ExbD [Steroidobacteraceae bacterium]
MYSTRQARKRLIRRLRRDNGEALNLVPMIDIFTVLVTFLLMTAVFYRTVVLELNLPTAQNNDTPPPPTLQLEVMVRKAKIQVADRGSGLLQEFPNSAQGYDLAALSGFLQRVKQRFPEKMDATILLEPDIPYDTLVQVMDTVRVVDQKQGERTVQAELFPEISIGDAPT